MFNFLNLNPEIVAVDVNDSSLRMVKLLKKHKGFQLVSFGEIELPLGLVKEGVIQEQDKFAKVIKEAFEALKASSFRGNYVAVSLPEEKSFSQIIQMPRMSEHELESAVPFEIENYIPLTVDQVYLGFQTIDEQKGHSNTNHLDLLINVMPRPIIDSYVYSFKKAGLVPCILEIESQSIVRALTKIGEAMPPVIFIDFGETRTSFIIYSENSIRFTSSIPISSKQLTEAIANAFGISFAKAEEAKIKYGLLTRKGEKDHGIAKVLEPILSDLSEQIKKYIVFYRNHVTQNHVQSKNVIEKIIISGGGANLKGFGDFLAKKINLPVEIGNPLINIQPLKKQHDKLIYGHKILSFTTALGLALRGAMGDT